MSRSPAAAVRAGSTPVAAKRSRTASHGSGVRSRCHTQMAEHARAEIVVRAVGQHDQPLATGPPEQRLADGQRRHARHHPHRHVGVGELRRPRPLRDAPAPRARPRRNSCGAPGPAAPAGPGAWPGSPSPSLLHPPFHDHLLVAVRVQERLQRPEHLAGRGALGPGGPARPARRRQRRRRHVDGHVIRAARGCGLGTGSAGWPEESHSKMASSVAETTGPSLVANSSASTASRRAVSVLAAARPRSSAWFSAARSGASRSHRNTSTAEATACARLSEFATAVSVAGSAVRARVSTRCTRPPARRKASTSAAPARAVASRPGRSAGRARCS